MKICKDCKTEKEESDFYGIQGECKQCTKKRVHKNYKKNFEYYKRYEVERNKKPKRKALRLKYQQKQRKANPEKYLSRQKVSRALEKGILEKTPCEECGEIKVEAHHTDYSKPLKVNWLCGKHHREADKLHCEYREAKETSEETSV